MVVVRAKRLRSALGSREGGGLGQFKRRFGASALGEQRVAGFQLKACICAIHRERYVERD
jgi:hypothetical protein